MTFCLHVIFLAVFRKVHISKTRALSHSMFHPSPNRKRLTGDNNSSFLRPPPSLPPAFILIRECLCGLSSRCQQGRGIWLGPRGGATPFKCKVGRRTANLAASEKQLSRGEAPFLESGVEGPDIGALFSAATHKMHLEGESESGNSNLRWTKSFAFQTPHLGFCT